MLAQADQDNTVELFFPQKHVCSSLVNIAQVIFLRNVVLDVFKQQWLDNIPMQCFPSMVNATLYQLFSS